MGEMIEIFCLKCKEITNLRTNGKVVGHYEKNNSIRIGGSHCIKITCKCGNSRLKFNGFLKKSDINGS